MQTCVARIHTGKRKRKTRMQAQMMNFKARRGRLHYLRGPSGGQGGALGGSFAYAEIFPAASRHARVAGNFRKANLREYVGGQRGMVLEPCGVGGSGTSQASQSQMQLPLRH